MAKFILIPLSFVVDSDPQRSIDAFAKLGVSKLKMLRHWLSLSKIFDRYRRGELTTPLFRVEIGKLFPEAVRSAKLFNKAWNTQPQVTDLTRKMFAEIEELEKQGIQTVFISGTNSLHLAHIRRQYGKKIPGRLFLSFKEGKLGMPLLETAIERIRSENPDMTAKDVAVFHALSPTSPYPRLGAFAWLLAPFKMWFRSQAIQQLHGLKSLSQRSTQFTLIPADFARKGVRGSLTSLEWLKNGPQEIHKVPNVITLARNHFGKRNLLPSKSPAQIGSLVPPIKVKSIN